MEPEESLRRAEGLVINIQHYCVHDGPGIRTSVFLQGCPLRCIWCSNPESQDRAPCLMWNQERCTGCGQCAAVCGTGALTVSPEGTFSYDCRLCDRCGRCAAICAAKARTISSKRMTAGEVLDQVLADALFYGDGGGLTLTGGEVTVQFDFAKSLLQLARLHGIGTALETCGEAQSHQLLELAALADVILFDVKVMDPDLHKRFTGMDNVRILSHLQMLSEQTACRLIVRTPVVPGCNDFESNYVQMGKFLKEHVLRCREVQLLPYHNLGEDKYMHLGVLDRTFTSEPPSPEKIDGFREILKAYVETVL